MSRTWAGLSSTDWVSHTAAQTSGITQLTSLPTDDNWMTKGGAATYLDINTSWTSYAAKGTNDWVVKQDLVSAFQYSGTLYYVNYDVGHNNSFGGWGSSGLACTHASALTTTVYWNGTIGAGTVLYYASGVAISAANTTDYFWMNGFNFTSTTSGYGTSFTITNYGSCASTTAYTLSVNNSSGSTVNGVTLGYSYAGGGSTIPITHLFSGTTSYSAVGIVGVNLLEIINTTSVNMTVSDVINSNTSVSVLNTTTNNGTTDVQMSVTLTSSDLYYGITIIFS